MVIKRHVAHLILILGVSAPTIPMIAAERELEIPEEVPAAAAQPAERSDKDEKQEKAEKDGKEKMAAQKIDEVPDRIPVEPLEPRRKDKEGNVIEEHVDSKDYDTISLDSFGDLILSQLKEGKHPVIAQVFTKMPDGSYAVHYFDPEGLHKEIQAKGFRNPNNKQPIKHLAYFVYVPNGKSFKYMCSYKSREFIYTLDHLQEWAEYVVAEAIAEIDFDAIKKLIHLGYKATLELVKHLSLLKLAEIYSSSRIKGDAEKAQQLYHLLIDVPEDIGAVAHARLAVGYFRGYGEWWQPNRERALTHALKFIDHSHGKSVGKDLCAHVCCIAGELLLENSDHKSAHHALGVLEKAAELAEETQLLKLKARAHACLAICYYNDPLFGEGNYSEEENGRYVKAWGHCIEALKKYEDVKDVCGFLDLVAEMRYFALGNEGDVKKALAYIDHHDKLDEGDDPLLNFIKINYGKSPILKVIINHRQYWHTKNKQEAIAALEKLAEAEDRPNTKRDFRLKIQILLAEIYANEARYAAEQAELHAGTDPVASLKYNNESYARRNQAGVAISLTGKYGINPKRPTFEWALAALTHGRLELWRPAKSYAKAANMFKCVYNRNKDFPLLASSACAELYELQHTGKISADYDLHAIGIHKKDPKYFDIRYQDARAGLQELRIGNAKNQDAFNKIISAFTLVRNHSPNLVLKMQARTYLGIAQEQAALINKAEEAIRSHDYKAAAPYLEQLLKSPNKCIQKDAAKWLEVIKNTPAHDGEHKERAAALAAMMPRASAEPVLAAAEPPRTNKRKGDELDREKSKVPKNDNGAGSGYVPAADLDKD